MSQELYNNVSIIIKVRGTRSRLQNLGHVCRLEVLKYMYYCQ